MAKQRITIGSILEINLQNGYYAYAQILDKGYVFYDLMVKDHLNDLKILENANFLFILTVYNDVITSGRWLKVGKLPIRDDLKILPLEFIQNPFNKDDLSLYDPHTGEINPTTKEAVIGLERASVWEAEHVESRIRDYYEGKSNVWVELMKLK